MKQYCYHKLIGYLSCVFCLWLSPKLFSPYEGKVLAEDVVDLSALSSDRAIDLLKQGIKLYEQQSFTPAKDLWLESASLYAQQEDVLGEALALNNIALAYQQLGEWNLAQETIARSLDLLQQLASANQPGYWEILAKVYNTQGNNQLHIGKAKLALKSWQDASQYYLRANNRSGIIIAQINQAKALQNLGFTVKALETLKKLERDLQQSNSQLKATGLRYLGISLRNMGNLEDSASILEQSIEIAEQPQSIALSWLELGNTRKKQGDRASEIGKDSAQEYYLEAMRSYDQAARYDSSLAIRLNQFNLLVDLGKYQEAEAFVANFQLPQQLEPNRENVFALLNYSSSLSCLTSPATDVPFCSINGNEQPDRFDKVREIINRAIALSREIQDPIAEAHAISQLAEVYELQGNYKLALDLNQQAILLLEGKSAADITYRLEWQLGRIYRQQGNIDAATMAYSQAISSLEKVRANIVFIDPQVQFSFRDRIEPVYREYADLLLTTTNNEPPSQDNLRQAIRAINALQLAELENFLGCDLSGLVALDEINVDTAAAQVYPIILKDRLVTIIDIPGSALTYRETSVSRSQFETTVEALQTNLSQPGKTPEVLEQGQKIYRWLIEPIELILETHPSIETLVFVSDSILQNIPFSALYDGEEYLIQKDYAIAVSPKLELFAPSASVAPLKVLTGGVEIAQTIEGISFPPIAQVEQELNKIATEVKTNDPLIDQAFTEINIKQELERGDFSAIHWKTHGVFSSDYTETFLVAYQDSIKANELRSLLQTASQGGQEPLELLVLSACETAKGDNRAILGLAGLTVTTGARSALSTLWRADDRATTLLMSQFYQQLTLGSTKADALRKAQLSLLEEEGYFAPYYWGTYVLIGNWL